MNAICALGTILYKQAASTDLFDVVLCQNGCRSTYGAEIEATMLLTRVGHRFGAIPLGEHHLRATRSLRRHGAAPDENRLLERMATLSLTLPLNRISS